MTTLIVNARKLDTDGICESFWVRFAGSRILECGTASPSFSASDTVIDAAGDWLTPGFIDLHCHGGGGHSFTGSIEEIKAAVVPHRRHGTTRTVVSLVSSSVDSLALSLQSVAKLAQEDNLILGSHLEGPFLSTQQHGAHNPALLTTPNPAVLDRLLTAAEGKLVQITIAPELPGALAGIDTLVANGVAVAIGHTNADYRVAREAFDHGATILTHAFNAMLPIHHREPGPIVAALEDERVTLELILDGHHVNAPVARLAFELAPARITLITDAMAAAGGKDGNYVLGTLKVTVSEGRAVLEGSQTLAGSTLTQDVALRYAINTMGISPIDTIASLTSTPARTIGREHDLGYLRPGYQADLVQLSPDWIVEQVWADGVPQI